MAFEDDERDDNLTEVMSSFDPTAVRIARDFLSAGGIESFIFDGEASRMLGSTWGIPSRLMVYADRAAEARERLQELGFSR